MNSIVAICHKAALFVCLFLASVSVAQNVYKESFNVGKNAVLQVNTSHTDVVFETWNKDKIEVEAFIEGKDLSEKEKKEIFDNWEFDVLGNSKKVVISSDNSGLWDGLESLSSLEKLSELKSLEGLEELGNLSILGELGSLNFENLAIDVPELEKLPIWPFNGQRPNLKNGDEYSYYMDKNRKSDTFDRGKYENNKQAYVTKLNKKYKTNVSTGEVDAWLEEVDEWGENIEVVMEKWGEDFGKNFEEKFGPEFELKMEKWGEEFGKKMEKWGEEFGEKFGEEMEKWGEEFGKDIEKWAEQFEDDFEGTEHDYRKEVKTDEHGNKTIFINGSKNGKLFNSKAKKKIIIRMPKGTKTDINVRHGEVIMADAYNVKATLNYSALTANSIDGGETLINASYGPVSVNNWVQGVLQLNYVDDCKVNNIDTINLQANSCDVNINTLTKSAILVGSFGDLFIGKIGDDFEKIDISLENTDATLGIPKSAFSFYYNGKKSTFKGPASLKIDKNLSGGRVLLNGFNKSKNSNRSFNINATYSNVVFNN